MAESIIYRKAKKTDFEQYLKIYKLFEEEYKKISMSEIFQNLSKKEIKKEFEEKLKNYFLVSVINNQVIGYIESIFYKKYKRGYIYDMFVLKEFRNKGIATKMKDIFIQELKKRKYNQISLDVNKINPAVKTYENWGFKIVKYRMVKKLWD